jgi:DNA polymerase-3 subunit alpha
MPDYCHLHNHTQYSLLDGASEIGAMMKKAVADGQKAIALTDHGNMFGAFKFVREANKNGVKPIVGCEFYLVEDRHIKSFSRSKGEKDKRYHQLLLAKNRAGYTNLSKLCSAGYIEGYYSKYPRIDKELVLKYHEGLIATSCCLGAEIPQAILHGKDEEAEEKLKWWLDLFGEDFYIELQRHRGLENIDGLGVSQEDINQKLLLLSKKYNVKVIATNDSHYVEEEDADPHDILLCINTGQIISEEKRFKFPSTDFYFKTQAQMNKLFGDVPFALDNTNEIASKVDGIELIRDVVLPAFPLPQGFPDQDSYLRHLTYAGAQRRYGTITPDIEERLNFELNVIKESGYPGYFLIVQDFTGTARDMGVSVGPGRGSAAGSAVAYCLGITNIDPIKYDLLFERFLNPERVSLPDIDIDFDDEGRSKVIDYVIDKYGKNQVAQIITYGAMKAKSSLRDVGRVLNIPLPEVDKVAKSFPTHLSASLSAVLAEKDIEEKLKSAMNSDDVSKAYQFRTKAEEKTDIGQMIRTAKKLEGSVRNTGIHACGVIITPDDIRNYIPVSVAKDSDFLVSQFDNSVVEDAGLLKMDFLGLKTLTIIKDAVSMVIERHKVELDIETVSLEDEKTYELFQKGETIGIFQYESPGMQKNLKELKPNKFEDLIAMNALYRPGPMQYIPNFIKRKHGIEKIEYDLADMEEYLAETYGITVYQEQVMLLSQKLAGFSKGQADMLRKGMGKKKKKIIDELFPLFLEGCQKNGHPEEAIKKIWKDWEAFASYAFNKSHSTCYAFIGFQTAYLKAHYPAEFMASVLNHNKSDITKVNFFLRECKRMRIPVLGPDINDSRLKFHVNDEDKIRFGLSALKGVGEGPVTNIVEERKEKKFTGIFDMTRRLNLRTVNKKCLEGLAAGGALDIFGLNRAQYFAVSGKYNSLIEHALKYGNSYQAQENDMTNSLFGDMTEVMLEEPKIAEVPEWSIIDRLEKEKEVTGIYISGHPLDEYRLEIQNYVDTPLDMAIDIKDRLIKIAGLVTEANHNVTQRGIGYVRFTMQDYNGSFEIAIFNEEYSRWSALITRGKVLYIEGINATVSNGRNYFRISKLMFLDTVGKNLTKSVTLRIPIKDITDELLEKIDDICLRYEGNHKFKLRLVDDDPDHVLNLVSHKYKVNATHQLLSNFKDQGWKYKIN